MSSSDTAPAWFPSNDAAVYVYAAVGAPSGPSLAINGIDDQPLLTPHREALQAHLERFRDRVEVGVRLRLSSVESDTPPDPGQAVSGRAYLEARRDERPRRMARDEAVITRYRTAVEPACVDWEWERRETDEGCVLSLVFLVSQSEADAALERLQAAESSHVREAHVVGPWAPHSFVTF